MELVYIILVLMLAQIVPSEKILFLGFPFYSHLQNLATLADVLNERGHKSYISAPPHLEAKLKLKERDIKTIPFSNSSKVESAVDYILNDEVGSPIKQYWRTGEFPIEIEPTKRILNIVLRDELFMSTIGDHKFDLIILDNTPIAEMLCIIAYKFDIPFIYLGVNYDPYIHRIPFSTAFVPYKTLPLSDQMGFSDRILNTGYFLFLIFFNPFSYRNAVSMYAPEKAYSSVRDIQRSAALTLVEWNFMLDYPSPDMPHVVKIGPITTQQSGQLPRKILNFLDKSVHGVVLVSFGSLAPTTRNFVLDKLVAAFEETKYHFIIKGSYTKSSAKMMVLDWIPQKALLAHNKVQLFITHCGANGVNEAIAHGVPMLGFPLFAEQPGNAFRMNSRGYGISMELFDAFQEEITENINELIENPVYKTKVKRASEILESRKSNATMDAVFWIEYVLKFGGEYLRSSSIDMPFYKFLLLDILCFISVIVMVTIIVVYFILKKCIKFFYKAKPKTE